MSNNSIKSTADGELKRCPFCGSKPFLVSREVSYVHCTTCGARTGNEYHELPSEHERISRQKWNARVSPSQSETIEALITCPTCKRGFEVVDEPLCPVCNVYVPEAFAALIKLLDALMQGAKAALKYADDLNEDAPVDSECKECVGRVYFTKGTPEPPLCWIHQLRALRIDQHEGKQP